VGVYEEADYVEDTFQLDHGDALVMYTDGVTEAMNSQKEEFGEQRLGSILGGQADKSSQGIVDVIKAGITDFVEGVEQSDDITILVLKRK
jgi:sigma-B regulation protein RsbU (phosphoserine phosphatase)